MVKGVRVSAGCRRSQAHKKPGHSTPVPWLSLVFFWLSELCGLTYELGQDIA